MRCVLPAELPESRKKDAGSRIEGPKQRKLERRNLRRREEREGYGENEREGGERRMEERPSTPRSIVKEVILT